ncbi:GTPase-activating Rap/Ran-GAP domain-like protein 3 isoform X1 [Hetaerina americana]|uniref:GTPase-activating Rap/Ran-GAP domain-like protein 3 isoform X1 n=1 Tax=Hetaerina americana TaxID=62018 RepID=UPI003A7F28A5
MLCLDMKFANRKGKKRFPSFGGPPPVLPILPQDIAVSNSRTSSILHQRDRSRSVCVDRLTALLQPEPLARDINRRRASASTASSSAAAADIQTSRRGLLWRRQYGSVELIPRIEDGDGGGAGQGSGGGRRFRVESGETLAEKDEMFGSPCTPVIENPEYQTRWYFKYFLGKLHHNYVGCLAGDKEPFFLSVVFGDVSSTHCAPHCKAILWKKTGTQKISLSYSSTKPMTVKQILSNFPNMEKIEKGPKEIFAPDIQKDLLLLEEQEGSVNFKFGVLLCRPGQNTDDEMLSNEMGSADFDRFVALLGDKVRLKGWDKYRGGLDIKGDMTGLHSVYTIYEGHEIMFHVSTLLPYSKENRQQVERKRHIGNDIVNIVFMDGGAENMSHFNPSYIKSQFTHIFALVAYDRGQSDRCEDSKSDINDNSGERFRMCGREAGYRLMVFSEESVPLFGPSLPSPSYFRNSDEFREFLLVKMINGEKAAFNTPTFAQKRERTLDMLLRDMYAEHMSEVKGAITMGRRALSDVISESTRGARRKEESRRQVELVRVGQALKLESIVKGDAPTSLATSSLFKRPQPWEPQCFYPDFHHEVICGDSWGESRLLVAAENGVHLVEEGLSQRLIFDKSVSVKQLDVVEAHGILLFRADKGRDCKVHVFRLLDFETGLNTGTATKGESIEIQPKTKHDLKEHRLERTRGCHLYALSKPGGSHLRMVVCVGRRLLIMQWRHSAAWTAWCPASDTDTVEGFLYLREVQVCEPPLLLSLVDVSPSVVGLESSSGVACVVGYKHQFDLVCCAGITPGAGGLAEIGLGECTPSSVPTTSIHGSVGSGNPEAIKQTVFTVETSHKPNLLSAIELPSDHSEPEVLLCYNNTCHFQKLLQEGPVNSEFDFHWNSVPNDIVVAFPYVLALTTDCLEIRLIVNGNLVYTSPMPKLKLISAKNDIFFATTAPEFFQTKQEHLVVDNSRGSAAAGGSTAGGLQFPHPSANPILSRGDLEQDSSVSPPPSPHSASPEARPFRFYRIPLHTLCGITATNSKPTSSQRGVTEREGHPANDRKTLAGKRGMTCTIKEGYGREDQIQESRSGNLRARLASGDKSDLDDDDGSLREETTDAGQISSGNSLLGVAPPQKGLSRSCSSSPTPGPRPKPHQSSLDSGK